MKQRKIRPAANGTDPQPRSTSSTDSEDRKWCTQCGEFRLLDEMAPDRRAKDGRRSVCREHQSEYDSARYQKNPKATLARQRQYRQENPGVKWFREYQRRAQKYGLTPVGEPVTREAIIEYWDDACFYCPDGEFEQIDHFVAVAAGGHHTIDNLVPCCAACNVRKRWEIDQQAIQIFRAAKATPADNAPSQARRRT